MISNRIPEPEGIQALADFWDSHDITDFEDELEEVTKPVIQREAVVTLHLATTEAQAVTAMAKGRGVTPDHLILEWVREKLKAA